MNAAAILLVHESQDGGDRGSRLFFHQPVAGIRDHLGGYVRCDQAKAVGHAGSEGFVAADPQDRHRELAFRRKGLVVDCILRERRELIEGRMHRAGPRVELGIVATRRFVDPLRIGRELVPEAVEIDSLAAFHQPLDIGSAEIEMPERWASDDLVPRPNAGKRRIHDDPTDDAIGKLGREGVAHHDADIVGHEIDLPDVELVQNAHDVAGLRFLVVTAFGMRREAHAA